MARGCELQTCRCAANVWGATCLFREPWRWLRRTKGCDVNQGRREAPGVCTLEEEDALDGASGTPPTWSAVEAVSQRCA